MSTPEQEMKIMNDPASCTRQCSYRGEGKCSFESCPYDEFPMHKGQSTVDICPICGTKITRPQLDHLPILCDKCITRLRKILTSGYDEVDHLMNSGRGSRCYYG